MSESIYRIEKKDDVVVMVLLQNNFTYEDNEKLMKPFDDLLKEGSRKIVLDFSQTKYVSSVILASLLFVLKRTQEEGGDLILCSVKDRVKEIMAVTNLDKVFNITSTLEEAVDKFKENPEIIE